jgi:hypothetical protein
VKNLQIIGSGPKEVLSYSLAGGTEGNLEKSQVKVSGQCEYAEKE